MDHLLRPAEADQLDFRMELHGSTNTHHRENCFLDGVLGLMGNDDGGARRSGCNDLGGPGDPDGSFDCDGNAYPFGNCAGKDRSEARDVSGVSYDDSWNAAAVLQMERDAHGVENETRADVDCDGRYVCPRIDADGEIAVPREWSVSAVSYPTSLNVRPNANSLHC